MRGRVYSQWFVATGLLIGMMGCHPFVRLQSNEPGLQPVQFTVNAASIAAAKQSTNVNAIVQVKGRVGKHVPLLGKTAYELQDSTGSIWVLTTGTVPPTGDAVVIRGKVVYQSIPINGKEQGSAYIEQQAPPQPTSATKRAITASPIAS